MVGTYDESGWAHNAFLLSASAVVYGFMLLVALCVEGMYSAHGKQGAEIYTPLEKMLDSVIFQRVKLYNTQLGTDAAFIRIFPSLIVCIIYVVNTYTGYIHSTAYVFLATFGVTMLLFTFVQIPVSGRPWGFVTRYETIVEVLSLTSLVLSRGPYFLNFSFLQAQIVLSRFLAVLPVLTALFWKKPEQHLEQKIRLFAIFFSLVYIFASGLQLFERLGDPFAVFRSTSLELTMWNALYFTFVTVFTVGYGDFIPYTLLGRTWMVFVVMFGVLLVTYKISKFHEKSLAFWNGEGAYVKQDGIKHCVICGNIKGAYLKAFVQEFYSDHGNTEKELVVMTISGEERQEHEKSFEKDARVHVFKGSCMNEEDLARAKVKTSLAVFVLNNQHNPNIYAEDSETLKRILTIRSFSPETPIFSMCALHDSMFQIGYALEHSGVNEEEESAHESQSVSGHSLDDDESDGMVLPLYEGPTAPKSEAICMQDLEMSMLAVNVFCNGMSTLLSNLLLFTFPTKDLADDEEPWLKEYKAGTENCFHFVKIPGELEGTTYKEIALKLYDHGVVLLATKSYFGKSWDPITPDTKFQHSSIALVITFLARIDLRALINNIADDWDPETTAMSDSDRQLTFDQMSHRTSSYHEIAGGILAGDGHKLYFDHDEVGEFNEYANDEIPEEEDMFVLSPSYRHEVSTTKTPAFDLPPAAVDAADDFGVIPNIEGEIAALQGDDDARNILDVEPARPITAQLTFNENSDELVDSEIVKHPTRSWRASTSPSRSALRRDSRYYGNSSRITGSRLPGYREKESRIVVRSPSFTPACTVTDSAAKIAKDGRSVSAQELPRITSIADDDEEMQSPAPRSVQVAEVLPDMSASLAGFPESNSRVENDGRIEANPTASETGNEMKTLRFHRRSNSGGERVLYPGQAGLGSSLDEGSLRKGSTRSELGGSDYHSTGSENKVHVCYGDRPLPVNFKNHIVVCVIGQMGMMNLKRFLLSLRVARRDKTRELQVVAICPVVTEESIQELEELDSPKISLVQGNTLSISSLRSAQYETASTIIILACEDKSVESCIDSRTIYTIMTLDHLIEENANIFVCSMIDSEESLHLLRAPQRLRLRIGDLGATPDASMLMRKKSFRSMRILGNFRSQYSMRSMASPRISRGFSVYDLQRTTSMASVTQRQVRGIRQSRSFVSPNLRPQRTTGGIEFRLDRRSSRMDFRGGGSTTIDQPLPRHQSFNGAPLLTSLSTVSKRNWMYKTSTAMPNMNMNERGSQKFIPKQSRDNAFEKERYASGEMMISSMFIALLIREFSMPGLTKVVGSLFGTRLETQPCWVRSIPVPKSWIPNGDGTKLLEYRDLCEKLLQNSCVPLGLYRCGAAPIRVFSPSEGESMGIFDYAFGDDLPSYRDINQTRNSQDRSTRSPTPSPPRNVPESSPMYPDRHLSPPVAAFPDGSGDFVTHTRQASGSYGTMGKEEDVLRLGDNDGEQYGTYEFVTNDYTVRYRVHSNGFNVLPYVYTNPEPYTVVSEHDAVYVLVNPKLDLSHLK